MSAAQPSTITGGSSTAIPAARHSAIPVPDPYRREIAPPFAAVQVVYDPPRAAFRYEVIEPVLTDEEVHADRALASALPRILAPAGPNASPSARAGLLRTTIDTFLARRFPRLPAAARARIAYGHLRDAIGFGPIDAVLGDPEVEDISCDGVGVPVFVYHARFESLETNVVFREEEALNGFVVRLAQRCGRTLSVGRPLLDGMTPEGHRVQATYAREVTSRGASFTIRRYRDRPFTPIDLVRNGTMSAEMVAYLWLAAEHGDSMIVCGGPGAGKTSSLNAIALFFPSSAKIVSIEDTREINLPQANWVPTTTRSASAELGPGAGRGGEIDMFDLLTSALRQRPSHLIVGEVRGPEAYTLFQAMSTGHATYATMHADSVRSMVQRLESPPIEVPRALLGSLREVLIETITRTAVGPARRIAEVVEVRGLDPETGELLTTPVFTWSPEEDRFHFLGHSHLFDRLAESAATPVDAVLQEFRARTAAIERLAESSAPEARELWAWIGRYTRSPDTGEP